MSDARPTLTTAMAAALQGVGGGLGWSVLPPLMPAIAVDLQISHTLGGLVWGAAPLGIALASPLGGATVDRVGPRRVAAIGMLVGAAAWPARAFAVDAWSLAAAMFVFGLHVGFVAPSIPKALAGHVPLAKLGKANGIAVLAYTLGTALTLLLARTVLAPAVGGWRPLMIVAGVAMAVAGGVWFALVRDRTLPSKHSSIRDVLALGRNPDLRRLATMQLLLFGGYLALLGLLPRAFSEAGMSAENIGVALCVWLLAAGVANVAGPWLSDRIGRRRPVTVVGALVAGGALALMAALPPETGAWLLIVAALGGGAVAPLLFTIPIELPGVGAERAGAAMGLLLLIGQCGGFLLPIAAGWAAETGGYGMAMGLLAVLHLLVVWPAATLVDTGRNATSVSANGRAPAGSPA